MEPTLTFFTAEVAAALPGPAWLRDVRQAAFERFRDAEQPTEAEEVWRYSRIDDLDLDRFRPSLPPSTPANERAASALQATPAADWLEGMGARAGLVVVRDGVVVASELSDAAHRQGVLAGSGLQTPSAPDLVGAAPAPDAFVELAGAFLPDVAAIVVPPRVVVDEPILVVHLVGSGDEQADADGRSTASFPRTVVRVGRSAEASVVEVAVSGEGTILTVPTVELDVSDDARLSYVGIQALGRSAWHLGYQQSRVGRDGHLVSFSMALGGSYARLRTDSLLAGTGGTSNLLAAYFGDGEQMHDFRTMQDHEAAKTTSDLLFKGAVAGEARSVYS
ncbi:MAG: SufD family Fe-S cluster assembly protein, partial [Acidimicrobiales bacterium]|nr:SufD family Fe-S cluster assembly protein [Acidimicrobiales bacterium]